MWLGGLVGAEILGEGVAREELEAAARALLPEGRHGEAMRTVRDGLAWGRSKPFDVTTIRGAA